MDFLASPKIELLTNSNYRIWSMKIEALLDSRDLFDDIINNPKPTKVGDAFNEWTKKNKQALGIIILSLSSDQAIPYKGIKNTQEIWNAIKLRYEGEAEDKYLNLILELTRLKRNMMKTLKGLPPEPELQTSPIMLKSESGEETPAQVPSAYFSLQQPKCPSTFSGDGSEDAQRWLKEYKRIA
ncbi:hypothetical protein LAZ67_X002147 [Cordylochernes scorpioides]|uniref:DUF4219 domain-containing protein n=1 Tax=Cordylochernes scorpioides TaxID=51811 RepID=A0ABY6LX98_9ARAC|nr:hypothetical protein LAZ67_X002147 [Cordylochernes scorpioides]